MDPSSPVFLGTGPVLNSDDLLSVLGDVILAPAIETFFEHWVPQSWTGLMTGKSSIAMFIWVMSATTACVAGRKANDGILTSEQVGTLSDEQNVETSTSLQPREEIAELLLPSCEPYGVSFQKSRAYETPHGARSKWTYSNALVFRYKQANGMFPQTNFAIQLLMAEFLAREPFLGVAKLKSADATREQWMQVAKVMTTLHQQAGVEYSSAQFPVPGTTLVADRRVKGLINGLTHDGLNLLTGSIRAYAKISLFKKPDNFMRDEAVTPYRCQIIHILGRMVQVFRTPAVQELNALWKKNITMDDEFDRDEFYTSVIRPKMEALYRQEFTSPKDLEAFEILWRINF